MAATCEVSELEIQREKKLLDRRGVERGSDGSRDLERDSERREERERGEKQHGASHVRTVLFNWWKRISCVLLMVYGSVRHYEEQVSRFSGAASLWAPCLF
jgi:hypothetical protein